MNRKISYRSLAYSWIAVTVLVLSGPLTVSNTLANNQNCWFDGWIQLQFSGDIQRGSITGWAGGRSVMWNVFSGSSSGRMSSTRMTPPDNGDEWVHLYVDQDSTGSITLSGWIRNTYVRWRSIGNRWNQYESCIR